ncbi:MAG: NYN domain-containing protein [Planctomycetes bacterium]|nr:NYN domain-containing protein [Planctomycetota bacterium]
MSEESKLALFFDFENLALGIKETKEKTFDVNLVLERLVEKGRIVLKKAYADWEVYAKYKRPFHEAAVELIYIPRKAISGKNSADIRLCVDALDVCHSKEHIDIFVIASGDSDFSPLVSKLRENNKQVIGLGVKNSTSALLIDNCDEFIFYEDLARRHQKRPIFRNLPEKKAEAFRRLVDAVLALQRENKEVIWSSMVKQTIQRKHPEFDEGYYGFSTFSRLLEDAEKEHVIQLEKDKRSGSYVVLAVRENESS